MSGRDRTTEVKQGGEAQKDGRPQETEDRARDDERSAGHQGGCGFLGDGGEPNEIGSSDAIGKQCP